MEELIYTTIIKSAGPTVYALVGEGIVWYQIVKEQPPYYGTTRYC